jgi:hypothetical protein
MCRARQDEESDGGGGAAHGRDVQRAYPTGAAADAPVALTVAMASAFGAERRVTPATFQTPCQGALNVGETSPTAMLRARSSRPRATVSPIGVGLITIRMEVRRDGGPSHEVEFLVDSGATLSVLPWKVWRSLGLRPKRAMRFALADGRTIRRRISECRFCFEASMP